MRRYVAPGLVLAIVAANCYVYYAMCTKYGAVDFTPRQVFAAGGMQNRPVLAGDYLRLITSTYVHVGLLHIASNMIGLVSFGIPLARRLNGLRFLVAYTLCGLAASVTMLIVGQPNVVCSGASGAIAGIPGMLLILRARGDTTIGLRELIVVLGINVVLPFVEPQIAWQAHVGGFLAGLVLGWLIVPDVRGGASANGASSSSPASPSEGHLAGHDLEQLERLHALRERAVLTDVEFSTAKANFLRRSPNTPQHGDRIEPKM